MIDTIQGLFRSHGTPRYLRSDNGPEFIARRMQLFLSTQQVQTKYIAPGCPWQNAYGENFNEKLRTEGRNA
ncbi:MAG: transposase family protein [Chloroflexi bacterium]|nr:transposase family protein [Chloroflexota bacterium]